MPTTYDRDKSDEEHHRNQHMNKSRYSGFLKFYLIFVSVLLILLVLALILKYG